MRLARLSATAAFGEPTDVFRSRQTAQPSCWDNRPADLAKADAIAVTLTPSPDDQTVAVFEPLAGLTVSEVQRVCPAPGQFQHAAARFVRCSANRAAGKEIAGLQIASADRVMSELL